jgi:hypothetical protein
MRSQLELSAQLEEPLVTAGSPALALTNTGPTNVSAITPVAYRSLRVSAPKVDRVHGFGISPKRMKELESRKPCGGLSSMLTVALAFPD